MKVSRVCNHIRVALHPQPPYQISQTAKCACALGAHHILNIVVSILSFAVSNRVRSLWLLCWAVAHFLSLPSCAYDTCGTAVALVVIVTLLSFESVRTLERCYNFLRNFSCAFDCGVVCGQPQMCVRVCCVISAVCIPGRRVVPSINGLSHVHPTV